MIYGNTVPMQLGVSVLYRIDYGSWKNKEKDVVYKKISIHQTDTLRQ